MEHTIKILKFKRDRLTIDKKRYKIHMKTTSRDATESGRGKPNIDFDKNNFFVFLFEKKIKEYTPRF